MPNLIHLLPPHIANQIAAGEVIQRPASAVKELLENAVDAEASAVALVVLDAGKALVQVIDNGKGMNSEDALHAFERHATSKISAIDDLYKIKTMGFRGEALASIAAVAQVVLKTKRPEDELGTEVEIENSRVVRREACAAAEGTSISMKNLFFNVPARRNFLKSNVVEMRHITDEFIRVALAFPGIFFSMTSNGQELFHLEKGTAKQRIVQVMGSNYANKLVQVHEHTDYMDIAGFIGKPETAKKTRGDQYLFVNNRFVKNAYLNHAVFSAYGALLPEGSFPFFAVFITLDPAHVDINVHPTKQEIKFDDDKIVYAFIQSAVRHALAQFSVSPALDFELDPTIQQLDAVSKPFTGIKQDAVQTGGLYKSFTEGHQAHKISASGNLKDWKTFFSSSPKEETVRQSNLLEEQGTGSHPIELNKPKHIDSLRTHESTAFVQLHLTFIVFEQERGMTILHQQLAHQQILFHRINASWKGKGMAVQQLLFPVAIQLSPTDAALLQDILPDLLHLGYQLEPFGQHAFLLQGSPADHPAETDQSFIEMILEDVKESTSTLHRAYREKMAKILARRHGLKAGKKLTAEEMKDLVAQLELCDQPATHFDGRPIFIEVKKDYLVELFGI
jgi:DNA mismatch repair protein MutL